MSSKSKNKVNLLGHLGADPEIHYTKDGLACANMSLATNSSWKDKKTGEKKEAVEWHRVIAFGNLAEICGKYLFKGSQIDVEGRLKTRKWNKDGIDHWTTEIIMQDLVMLSKKTDHNAYASVPTPPDAEAVKAAEEAAATSNKPVTQVSDIPEEDDIPF